MAQNEKIMIDELRPVAHQHLSMLTAAGVPPAQALAIAAHVCALIYSGTFDEAIAQAFKLVDDGQRIGHPAPLAE